MWLTSWAPDKVKTLLSVLYCEKFLKGLQDQPFKCANWTNYSNKVVWLSRAMLKLDGREWYWIDDDVKAFAKEIPSLCTESSLGYRVAWA